MAESQHLEDIDASLSEFRQLVKDIALTACNTALLEAGFPTEEYIQDLAVAVKCGQCLPQN